MLRRWMKWIVMKFQGRGAAQQAIRCKDGKTRRPIASVGLHLVYIDEINGQRRLMGVGEADSADDYWLIWEELAPEGGVYMVDPTTGKRERFRP